MTRLFAASLVLASLQAPLQCGHGGDAATRDEDPGDAVYALAMDFRAHGNEAAATQALRYLVEHYPSNRHATEAKAEIDGSGAPAAPSAAASTAR